MEIPEPPRQWACFANAATVDAAYEQVVATSPEISATWCSYTVKHSKLLRGEAVVDFKPGEKIKRLMTSQALSIRAAGSKMLTGVTQHLHYTSHAQRAHLVAVSAKEIPASWRTRAVLIPIRKNKEWWNLAHDARAEFFVPTSRGPGHTAIGEEYAGKIYRQLLHARYLESAGKRYDFLTYFEFFEEDTPAFLTLLKKLRDETQNPEWRHVDLEQEIWMKKSVG